MHVHIVFAHPSRASFTWEVFRAFQDGLSEAGHSVSVSDLYADGFQTDMDPGQYEREMGDDPGAPVPPDVRREQEMIEQADGLAFIYPVWWSDVPAKLKGWFDRVWTYGWAYLRDTRGHFGSQIDIEQALVLCPAGHPTWFLEEIGIASSMRAIMVDDRILGVGVRNAEMVILGGMTGDDGTRRRENLLRAQELGRSFAQTIDRSSPRSPSEPSGSEQE